MDLETATIDQMYDEIEKRCEGCVLIMQKTLKNPVGDVTSAFAIRWKDFVISLGLIDQTRFYFQKHYLKTYEDIDSSDVGLEK